MRIEFLRDSSVAEFHSSSLKGLDFLLDVDPVIAASADDLVVSKITPKKVILKSWK
jgi:hypothetical protein